MPAEERVGTLDVVPRDYCLCFLAGSGTKIYFTPVNAAKANLMIRNPGEIDSRVRAMQRYKADSQQTGVYEPVFLFSGDELKIKDPYNTLRDAVKKREGYYKLLDMTRKEAVSAAELRGSVLNGIVASKKLRQVTTPTDYTQVIKGVFLDRHGHVALSDVNCTCPDHVYDTGKGPEPSSRMHCVHTHALLNYYAGWLSSPSDFPVIHASAAKHEQFFDPFTFSSNWRNFDRKTGRFWPSRRSLASLEYEIPWEYYVREENNFSINSRLLHNSTVMSELFSDPLLDGIARGKVVFEVVRQKPVEERISRAESGRHSALYSSIYRELSMRGYVHNGYCIEMGRPARRFESADFIMDLVMDDGLLYYIARKKVRARPDLSLRDEGGAGHLASQVNTRQERLDDRTRVVTPTYAGVPTRLFIAEEGGFASISVPQELKRRYRAAVEKHSAKPASDIRKFGLE